MNAFAEEGLREIDELSLSSGSSIKASIEGLENESPTGETQEKVKAMAMDTEARMLALYQLAALKAKKSDDVAQIRKIWNGPLLVYESAFRLVSNLVSKGNRNPYIIHLFETVGKLRDQVRWVYELHTPDQ